MRNSKRNAQQKKGPAKFGSAGLVDASIKINGKRYRTLITEGATHMQLLEKVARENNGGVVKLYYPEFGTSEIVGIKVGREVMVKGDPKALRKADYGQFGNTEEAKRFFTGVSERTKNMGAGGIHSFIGSGIPVIINKKGSLEFPNLEETPVTRNINEVTFALENSNANPRTVQDILKMYGRKDDVSEIVRKAASSHGGFRFEKIEVRDNILLIDKESGEIRSPSRTVIPGNGREISFRKNDGFSLKKTCFQTNPVSSGKDFFSYSKSFFQTEQRERIRGWHGEFTVQVFDGFTEGEFEEQDYVDFCFTPPPACSFSDEQEEYEEKSRVERNFRPSLFIPARAKRKNKQEKKQPKQNAKANVKTESGIRRGKTGKKKIKTPGFPAAVKRQAKRAGKFPAMPLPKRPFRRKPKTTEKIFVFKNPKNGKIIKQIKWKKTVKTRKRKKGKRTAVFKTKKRLLLVLENILGRLIGKKEKDKNKKRESRGKLIEKLKKLLGILENKKKKKSSEEPGEEVHEKGRNSNNHKGLYQLFMLYIKLKNSITVKEGDGEKVDGSDNEIEGECEAEGDIDESKDGNYETPGSTELPKKEEGEEEEDKEDYAEDEIRSWSCN